MSFTNPELKARLQILKNRFEEIDCDYDVSTDIGGEVSDEYDLDERHFTIRIGIIANLFRTMKNSLDQISICFEVSKAMFFYQDEIVNNPEFWAEERRVNQTFCSNNFKMAMSDMQEAGAKLMNESELLKVLQGGGSQDRLRHVINCINDYQILVGRFDEYTAYLGEAEGRQNGNIPLYDADQKPKVFEQSPESYLKGLHKRSSQNADMGLVLNADLVESCFASIDFANANKMEVEGVLPDIKLLPLILHRFDALEDARDNRYGFTQMAFG